MNHKIKRKNWYFLFFYLLILVSFQGVSAAKPEVMIDVGILSGMNRVSISGEKELKVTSKDKTIKFPAGSYAVTATGDGLKIGKKHFTSRVEITSIGYLRVNKRGYRGSLILIKKSKNRFTVVNRLELEQYLYGIMLAEISPDWPEETLKAQAVISRTYALKNLTKHSGDGFNLCDTVHCQVYAGSSGESVRTNQAVDTTREEILVYDGEPISAFFHSTCAGYTDKPSNVWGSTDDPEYLEGVKCDFCEDDPRYHWEHSLSKRKIASVLKKRGYPIDEVEKLEI